MPTDDIIRTRQRTVSNEGYDFQVRVKDLVNAGLETEHQPMKVLINNEIFNDPHLKEMFLIPVRGFKKVWGDVDLVVKNLENNYPVALISCKTSLHGRFSETLFYSIVYKTKIPDIKVVFATPDKGRQGSSSTWETEWGSLERPTKDRYLSETYLDGVYIDNDFLRTKWGVEGHTSLGGKVKPITQLVNDLVTWSRF